MRRVAVYRFNFLSFQDQECSLEGRSVLLLDSLVRRNMRMASVTRAVGGYMALHGVSAFVSPAISGRVSVVPSSIDLDWLSFLQFSPTYCCTTFNSRVHARAALVDS